MVALRLTIILLALTRAMDGLRLTLSGVASSLGHEGWFWLSPGVARAIAEASILTGVGRLLLVLGYIAVAWLVWRRDPRALTLAAGVFLFDLFRWALHSGSAAYSAAHISAAGADGPFLLDLVDLLKLSVGAAILLGVFLLDRSSGRADR